MPYETLHVHIGGSNPAETKSDIEASARVMNMSVSRLLMYAYEQLKPRLADLARRESQKRLNGIR